MPLTPHQQELFNSIKEALEAQTPLSRAQERDPKERSKIRKDQNQGLITLFQRFIDAGGDINCKTSDGYTALHFAAQNDRVVLIKHLLGLEGIEVDVAANNGDTPLHLAAQHGRSAAANILIQAGANIDVKNIAGFIPLQTAINSGKEDVAAILQSARLMLSRAEGQSAAASSAAKKIKIRPEKNKTSTFRVRKVLSPKEESFNEIIESLSDTTVGEESIIKTLEAFASGGGSLNHTTDMGYTPLHIAAKNNRKGVVAYLLEKKVNVDALAERATTPLHVAAYNGRLGIVDVLINNGANVNAQEADGSTPLHNAVMICHLGIVQRLLAAKAAVDVEADIKFEDVAAVVEVDIKLGDAVDVEEEEGLTPLQSAAQDDNSTGIVKALVAAGANVGKIISKSGKTALHMAAEEGRLENVMHLIEKGATVDLKDKKGFTALHYAAQNGRTATVEWLIVKGATADLKDNEGFTALHRAAQNGRTKTAVHLVEKGAKIDLLDNEGFTALHRAAQKGHIKTFAALIDKGANIYIKTGNGEALRSLAERSGHREIVALIDERLKSMPAAVQPSTAAAGKRRREGGDSDRPASQPQMPSAQRVGVGNAGPHL